MAEIKPLTAISYNYMRHGPESFLPNAHSEQSGQDLVNWSHQRGFAL